MSVSIQTVNFIQAASYLALKEMLTLYGVTATHCIAVSMTIACTINKNSFFRKTRCDEVDITIIYSSYW